MPRRTIQIIDLAFGDCGKGALVDYLARLMPGCTVVRFNGGPQAGHNVVTPDGRHHTFSQFGAGTFVPGVRTFLSRFMLIEPYALLKENEHLDSLGVGDALDRLTIDARCRVITPAHQAANRLRERLRGAAAHGTCGMGVGETVQDSLEHPEVILHAADLADRQKVLKQLQATCDLKIAQLSENWQQYPEAATLLDRSWIPSAADNYAELAQHIAVADDDKSRHLLRDTSDLIFEGAQGVLLDEDYGFHPHTTWSRTTFANADALLDEADREGKRQRMGVLRTYFTRHGPGPFVTEDPMLAAQFPEPHNTAEGWQGSFRVGVFDAVAARYAMEVAGDVDALAITHVDRLNRLPGGYCVGYHVEAADEAFFDFSSGAVAGRIKPIDPGDHLRRQQLSDCLKRASPEFRLLETSTATGLARALNELLHAPVAILSFGSAAREKELREGSILEVEPVSSPAISSPRKAMGRR